MLRKAADAAFWRLVQASPRGLSARLSYLKAHGRLPDLAAPERFTERVFAQKLRGDQQAFARLSDKVLVKDHVARMLGPAWVTPTLWHGPVLPPRGERDWPLPFVLKANHGSTMNALVRSRADLDWDRLEREAERWLGTDWPRVLQEDWYNRIERQLLVEPLLGDGSGDVPDYKVFVFSGRATHVQVDTERSTGHTRVFYDRDWVRQPFSIVPPTATAEHPRPPHLDAILGAAEALGAAFEYVRVDFYDLPEGPRFGEMTFAPTSGLKRFAPEAWDLVLGRLWEEERRRAAAG